MSDEGCPNEGPSVDDATAYSKEEEEDLRRKENQRQRRERDVFSADHMAAFRMSDADVYITSQGSAGLVNNARSVKAL